jgi:8-oxo-dGTP pyrophosphatase MutT (NUDIX family)
VSGKRGPRERIAPPPRFADLAARLARRAPRVQDQTDRPRAAVAVILAPDPDSLLLIRRAERDGDVWSGHLAFPGGRASRGDPDLRFTAQRETREEVGLRLESHHWLGQLDDLVPSTAVLPPILVRPFVFSIEARHPLLPNLEVAAATWVPVADFLRPEAFRPTEHRRHGTLVRSMGYYLDIGVVWGLTERILTPLLELLAG